MDFGTEAGIFLAYTACLLAIYFFGKLLIIPFKFIMKLLLSSIIGGVVLLIINEVGGSFGIFLPLNVITAAITGVTGVPGVVMLLVYFQFLS